MFEGLIEFIETTIFGLINDIDAKEPRRRQAGAAHRAMLLDFATPTAA
jgi:TetR/AcrR family transcriptional regulator